MGLSLPSSLWETPTAPTDIKRGLAALVLVSALPFVVFSAFLLGWGAQAQRETLMTLGEQSARAVANSLDQDVAKGNSFLKGIAIALSLHQKNWPVFFEQSQEIRLPNGGSILVYDVNASAFFSASGAEVSQMAQDTLRASAVSERMQLSAAFMDAGLGELASVVTEPVKEGAEMRYVLGLVMPARSIAQLVNMQGFPQSWIAAIFDDRGMTIARTHGGAQYVGKPGKPDLIEAIRRHGSGRMANISREGIRVENGFATTAAGWLIAIGIPEEEFNALIRNSMLLTSAIGLLLGLLSLTLAFIVGNHLARPVAALADAARDLGRGVKPRGIASSILELSVVQAALEDAHADLRRKEADRSKAETEVRHSEERLRLAMDAGGLGAWEYEPATQTFLASPRCEAIIGYAGAQPFAYEHLVAAIHPEDRALQSEAFADSIAKNGALLVEYRVIYPDGGIHWVRINGKVFGDGGDGIKLVGVSQNITREKTAAQLQALLLGELNHRVKNSLAQIVAIVHFTRRSQGNTAAAWDALERRIHALAKTHDLLTANEWRGGQLRDVLLNELAAYQDGAGERLLLTGEPVSLSPKAMLALGLAVHELGTNAAKYGALSRPEGRVSLDWAVEGNGGDQHVLLKWQEMNGPPVAHPTRTGFGSRLIEQVFTRELRGSVQVQFQPDGLRCNVSFPLEKDGEAASPAGEPAPPAAGAVSARAALA